MCISSINKQLQAPVSFLPEKKAFSAAVQLAWILAIFFF